MVSEAVEAVADDLGSLSVAELVDLHAEVTRACVDDCAALVNLRRREAQLAGEIEGVREQIKARDGANGRVKELAAIGEALVKRLAEGME